MKFDEVIDEVFTRERRLMMRYVATVLLLLTAMSAQNVPMPKKGRQLDIPSISREARGAVVSIVMFDKDGNEIAEGSGFIVSKDGRIVTNYHVIKNGTSALIKFPNSDFYFPVDGVLASDKNRDVAIIQLGGRIEGRGGDFRTLTLGDSDRLQVGEEVVAIGNPLSLESTVSNGIVSAVRTLEEGTFLQVTAPISPGSSGGPLFNMQGEVVGITTLHAKDGENLNFAIPINDIKSLLKGTPSKVSALPNEPETETGTAADSADSAGPSLADTLQWMASSSAEGIQYWEGQSDGSWFSDSFSIFPGSSCDDFRILVTMKFSDAYTNVSGAARFHWTFNLSDVDPDSIHEDSRRIDYRVTDDHNLISLLVQNAPDLDHLDAGKFSDEKIDHQSYGGMYVSDQYQDYRDRLVKAFKHAVTLCGGKPSKF